jgi:peptidoglycan/xylan/chitin deacetylase (PgdA/CDA1 family)
MKIKSDTLHSFFVGVASSILLRQRDILKGQWNGSRCVCLSFDCDYREDIEACNPILEFLQTEEISTSFAIPGHLAIAFPDFIEELIRNDHEILNHTFSHFANFRSMASNDIRFEVENFQEFMTRTYNYVPKGFRSPHGLRKTTAELFEILKENGMYDSSLLGYGVTNINGIWEIPITPCPEHPLMAFDTYHHFRFPVFLSSEKKLLRLWMLLLHNNVLINIFLDPIDLTTNTRLNLLEQMIERARELGFTFNQMGRLHEDLSSSRA